MVRLFRSVLNVRSCVSMYWRRLLIGSLRIIRLLNWFGNLLRTRVRGARRLLFGACRLVTLKFRNVFRLGLMMMALVRLWLLMILRR